MAAGGDMQAFVSSCENGRTTKTASLMSNFVKLWAGPHTLPRNQASRRTIHRSDFDCPP